MDSRFLKFFVLFYAYNKYNEHRCGIYLRFTLTVETSVSIWLLFTQVTNLSLGIIMLGTLKETYNFFQVFSKAK